MEEEKTKKSSKAWLWILLIILVAAIAAGGYLYYKSLNTKEIFTSQVNQLFESYGEEFAKVSDKINTTVSLSANIEAQNEQIKPYAQIINDGKLTFNVQQDPSTKKTLVGLNVDYQNQSLIKGNVFYAEGDSNLYFFVQDLFDKYFKIDINKVLTDESQKQQLQDALGGNMLLASKEDANKVITIIEKEIEANLEDKYFTRENVDGMTKNSFKISSAEIKQVIITIANNLKNNKEFLSCYKNQNKVIEILDTAVKEMSELTEKDESELEVSIYTTGLLTKEVKKIVFSIKASENKNATLTIVPIDENNYEYELSANTSDSTTSVQSLKGTVKVEKTGNVEKTTIVAENIPSVGKVTLNVEVQNEQNTTLDTINVADSVDIMSLTPQQQAILSSNLTKMRIYSLIAPFLMRGMQ